jgi:hypothetical protein
MKAHPMTDSIPPDLVDRMMVKCARRCCICRRYRPTKLQVHHIVEQGQGGGNEEDNLIVSCFSCHSDVHTKVPFARRFSESELKGHRDALVKMVEEGKFPALDTDDADEAMRAVVQAVSRRPPVAADLLPEATELLLLAANASDNRQGCVLLTRTRGGDTIAAGNDVRTIEHENARRQARYGHAIQQLVRAGYWTSARRASSG